MGIYNVNSAMQTLKKHSTENCHQANRLLFRQVGSAGGARNSGVYNENAFLLSARSMVHCIRQPPSDFRPLMQVQLTRHIDANEET